MWQMYQSTKGQIKPKAVWVHLRHTKKLTNEFVFFAVKSKKANKTNLFIHFLGEPTAGKSVFGFIWPLSSRWFIIFSLISFENGTSFLATCLPTWIFTEQQIEEFNGAFALFDMDGEGTNWVTSSGHFGYTAVDSTQKLRFPDLW